MRILARLLALIAILALLVTACQPAGQPTGSTGSAVDQVVLGGKPIEVVFWHNRPQADQDVLQAMLNEFNASNPYSITARAEIAGASYNDVYNKINAAIQAGSPPNMAVAYQNQAAFYRSQGAVIDLTPYISSSKYGLTDADKQDYFSAFLASDVNPQFPGETLGFPTQRSIEVMYYNVDWLTQLGYASPPADWATWEQVACKASQEAGKFGWAFRHDASNFASMVFSRGGRILAPDGKSYVFNSQAGIDSLTMIQRMAANKCLVEIPVSESFGEQNRFANGTVLFVIASSSGLPYYAQAVTAGAKFKWDIATPPQSGELHMNLYGASISVFKSTPEQQLASWLVLKFLGEPAQTARWAEQTGYMPVRMSVKDQVISYLQNQPSWSGAAQSYAKLFDWANAGEIESPVAGYDAVRNLIDQSCMTVVLTNPTVDPKSILDAAVQQANQILSQNAPTSP